MTVDLDPAVRRLLDVADGVTDDQLDDPTPCAGRSVRQLLGHVVGLTAAFRAAADKDLGEWTDANPDADGWPDADDDWREVLAERGPALVAAWRAPEASTGMTRAGGVDLPGEVAGLVALDEVVLHGWDLARATGQDYPCDEAEAEAVRSFVSGFDPGGTPGLFGPAVEAPEGASTFEQVLARSGRDPRWAPPGAAG
jgi:uncharacterized protein (TIGR03086 family)